MWNTLKGKWNRLPSFLRKYLTAVFVMALVVLYLVVLAILGDAGLSTLVLIWLILGAALIFTMFTELLM